MKILKTLGFLILGLIALFLIIGAFQPTEFNYERSADIDASKEIIFSKINDLKTWNDWGPWKESDSTIQVTYSDVTEGLGASYSWTGELSGSGELTVTESTPPTWQKTAIDFDGYGGNHGWFKLEDEEGGSTKTSWGMSMKAPYPWNAMMLFSGGAMEKQMHSMFDTGLKNLKTICEKEAKSNFRGFAVKPMEFSGQTYLAVNGTVKFTDMKDFYTNSYGAIGGAIGSQGLEMAGQPCGVYYEWNEEAQTTKMAAAIPVKGGVPITTGNVQPLEIPKGKCVVIDYYGDYEGIGEAHFAMDDYFKANGIEPAKLVMEEYVTDPGSEPDPAKWLTKVYYFLEGPLASED